jgi:hypothetical protein
MLYVKFSLKH